MELPSYFTDFLVKIRPSAQEKERFKAAHQRLREALISDEELRPLLVTQFLQGSYRRATALRSRDKIRPDVDVVAVTKQDPERFPPAEAMRPFTRFLDEHYPGQWLPQGRSLGITDTTLDVDLDLVITASPTEASIALLEDGSWVEDEPVDEERAPADEEAAWRLEPLLVPDREVSVWQPTHPLAQLAWTRTKNRVTHGHFVNVVKALKWWKCQSKLPKHPKSYPLERLIGESCPDDARSVADGLTRTLEDLVSRYQFNALVRQVPVLAAPGVPGSNVLARLSSEDFRAFYDGVVQAARLSRDALEESDRDRSALRWRELLGPEFPAPEGGFTEPSNPAQLGGGRFG